MHHPRSNANCWQEFREGGERYHPKGPQGICFFESAGNHVFRYNDFTTDDHHYCNDIFGGGANRSLRGFPGADSDVYGNHIEGCWDDGLELEGGGCNVRVWGNYIDRTMVKIAIAGLSVGPIYIFRNVAGISRFGHTSWRGEPFLKMGGAPLTGGGRAYVFHNTILQPPGPPEAGGTIGCAEGLNQSGGPELLSVVSRNNILHVRNSGGYSIRDASRQPTHDYDYDLLSGKVVSAGKQEPHGVVGVPVYATSRSGGRLLARSRQPRFRRRSADSEFQRRFPRPGPRHGRLRGRRRAPGVRRERLPRPRIPRSPKKRNTAMTHLTKALCPLAIGLGCLTSQAREYEGARENAILINGQWEFTQGDGSEHAESPAGQRTIDWQ